MITSIPERPIYEWADELLGREPFVRGLADLILNAPRNASLRIGVYGDWGEGKTSVLALMRQQLKAAGHECVWLAPWLSATREDIGRYLVGAIAGELGIDLTAVR